eukprot:TRINITY_DN18094_c0_g1_i1.p1 TRINITY_DN18094_c0_g1~~TRINITY_DN18094_c0_g1_i1.p1  ORF type:complete len:395 (-),score=73.00 TRINITY_DN18094_c0_g1_i1:68-1219(-)
MAQALFVACLLLGTALANTKLPDNWTPPTVNECTSPYLASGYHVGPPYTGANADPDIAEGVGSGSVGNTCNFRTGDVQSHMFAIYKNNYLAAASQDLYAGKHLPSANADWSNECEVDQISRSDAASGRNMCSTLCGECVLVNGVSGSAYFVINEIADYDAVGQNGVGINLHLDDDHALEVRDWLGVSKDITFKRMPCPVSGSIYLYIWGNWGTNAVYIVAFNHRLGVKAMLNRGGAGGNQEWVPLVRDWTNRWHWENYGCDTCIDWQSAYGGIDRNSTKGDFQLQLVANDGDSVVCTGLSKNIKAGAIVECVDENGKGQQFSMPTGMNWQACDNTTPVNWAGGGSGSYAGSYGDNNDNGDAAASVVAAFLFVASVAALASAFS